MSRQGCATMILLAPLCLAVWVLAIVGFGRWTGWF